MQQRRRLIVAECAALATVAIWPFIFLAPYTQNEIGIGNDFLSFYFNNKVYLLAMLRQGHFPLWSPTEGAGLPFFSNPLAQTLYPLNLLYLAYYKILGRFVEWDYQMLTIFALSIYGAGLYLWLRRLKITTSIALLAVLVAVSSLKVTELIRFPNAAHSAAWMPWLLYAATLAADRRRLVAGSAVFAVALLMLFTAGYPYFIIYSAFLIAPYVLAMNFSVSRRAFLGADPEQVSGKAAYIAWLGGGALLASLIALPYLLQVQSLMAQTIDRGAPNFEFATHHLFGPLATLGSWIFPPAASMEGWYYFGMATTLMIAFYLLCAAFRYGITPRDGLLLAFLVGWMVFVIYFTWGRDSVIFTWLWHHVPVLNQMRVWGRMNIILVPAIALLLAIALSRYLDTLGETKTSSFSRKPVLVIVALMLITAVTLALQYFLYRNQLFDDYWTFYFKQGGDAASAVWGKPWQHVRNFDEKRFLAYSLMACLALIGLWLAARKWPHAPFWRSIALIVFFAISTREMFYISNYQWMYLPSSRSPVNFDPPALLRANFDKSRSIAGWSTISYPSLQYGVGLIATWGLVRHADVYLRYFNWDAEPRPGITAIEIAAATRFFGADKKAERIFITQRMDHSSPLEFLRDVDNFASIAKSSYQVDYYDGDRLQLTISATQPCWVTFVDNWDPNWTAEVNGNPATISLALGSYKVVPLPAGTSDLVFTYKPPLLPWQVKE